MGCPVNTLVQRNVLNIWQHRMCVNNSRFFPPTLSIPNNHHFIKFPFFIRCRFFFPSFISQLAKHSFLLLCQHYQLPLWLPLSGVEKKNIWWKTKALSKIMYITTWFEFREISENEWWRRWANEVDESGKRNNEASKKKIPSYHNQIRTDLTTHMSLHGCFFFFLT